MKNFHACLSFGNIIHMKARFGSSFPAKFVLMTMYSIYGFLWEKCSHFLLKYSQIFTQTLHHLIVFFMLKDFLFGPLLIPLNKFDLFE